MKLYRFDYSCYARKVQMLALTKVEPDAELEPGLFAPI
jgi:hypothetical protein